MDGWQAKGKKKLRLSGYLCLHRGMPSHTQLARWYFSLERFLAAGIPLGQALEEADGVPLRWRREASRALADGESWDEVLRRAPRWLGWTDRYILSAGAESGRLPETIPLLRTFHEEAAETARKVVGGCIYPLVLINLAILLFPIPSLATEGGPSYAAQVLPILIPVWVGLAVLITGIRQRWPSLHLMAGFLPGLRGAIHYSALARFVTVLRALYLTGAPLEQAWFGAGKASGVKSLEKVGQRMAEVIQRGQAPGEVMDQFSALPPILASFYRNGEKSGTLEESLGYVQKHFQEETVTRFRVVSFWYPKVIYFAILIAIAYQVVRAFQDYVDLLDGMF